MASLRTSVEHLIRNIDEFVLARVRRYRSKSTRLDDLWNARWQDDSPFSGRTCQDTVQQVQFVNVGLG